MLITLKSDIRAPSAPVLGTPTATSASSITVPMTTPATDLQSVASYALESALAAAGPFTEISAAATFPYSATGLTAGTAYYFRARATDASGNVGSYSAIVSTTTLVLDVTPTQFTFTDQTSVAVSSTVTSAAITIGGLSTGTSVTLTAVGGTIDKNGSGTFASSQSVTNGDTVRARVTASALNSTAVNCVVTAAPSGITDTFTATTIASGSVVKPGPTNTGYRVPLASLVAGTTLNVSAPGTVISGRRLTGRIRVDATAHNTTIRDCFLDLSGTELYGVNIAAGVQNLVIEYCEIKGCDSAVIYQRVGGTLTIRNCNIHDSVNDVIKVAGGATIEYNWIYNAGSSLGAHADGVQIRQGSNIMIRGNFFDMRPVNWNPTTNTVINPALQVYKNSQPVFCQIEEGAATTADNIVVDGNWFDGSAAYAVSLIDSSGYTLTNCHIRNNRFTRANFLDPIMNGWCYRIRPASAPNSYNYPTNVWDEDGTPLPNAWQVTV